MNYMPRLVRLIILTMNDTDVVEHEAMYVLVKSKEDLEETVDKYKELFSNDGEVFVRATWLSLTYSDSITNDLSDADAKFIS